MEKIFKIGLIQMDAGDDISANQKYISKQVEKAAEKGANLIILPEHSDAIGRHERRFETEVPGAVSEFYSNLAKKYKIYLHCGSMTEKSGSRNPYNTSLLFDPSGNLIASYRKLHMFDVEVENGPNIRESDGVTSGDKITVAETPLAKLGLSICYDLRFCEIYRLMALQGAQILIVSANFTENTGKAHWETLVRARAIENGCYVAAVNQCGEKYNFTSWGHTMLVDPWGRIIDKLSQDPGLIIADIDLSAVEKAQNSIPVLKNLRSDVYRLELLDNQ